MKAFYPYGQEQAVPSPQAAARLHPGAAEVVDGDGRRGIEVYRLERTAEHWRLSSNAFDESWRLLARVHHTRLPAEPVEAATELLVDLWTLRQSDRLRFVRGLEVGALGKLRWQRIEEELARPAPLEDALRAEGLEVRTVPGPVGTTEHVLLFRR
ncbi:MAG: hypothetical protein ACT4PK_01090 [Gammaproteobacteria bacterium]